MTTRRLLIAVACCVSLVSCNRSNKKTIAVIPKATSHLFWVSVQAGALAAGKHYNVNVEWNGPTAETDYSRQIQIVDSMIARHVDGIAIAATERKALVQSLDRAAEAKIPVTVFDSGLDSENYMTFVATDNVEAGRLAAREMARLLDGKGNIAMILHAPGSVSTGDREQGFQEVIAKEFPNIKIVAQQYGMSDRARSRAAAENILSAHPDLNGMFCSTEPSSTGTSLALKSRNLAGKVKFVAFDSSDSMIQDLRDGVISVLVVQDPFRIGFEAVRTLVDKLNGKNPPKRIDLAARTVTRDQLDSPEVKELLRPDVKKYLN
ncbi:MAG: substrate-binding domain-containing protein [Bryobacteraceae bacterium]